MSALNNIIIWIGTGVILISLILAVIVPKNNIAYMKGFFICPLISLLVSVNSISSRFYFLYPIEKNFLIQSILHLFDLLFWTWFFLKVLNEKKDSRNVKILFVTTLLFACYLLFKSTSNSNLHIHALSNMCKTFFCIFFYNNLFKKLPDQNILLKPSFWIVTGLIFYSCLSLPFYALSNYVKARFSPLFFSNIFAISNMLIIIMYLFFIKAFVCTIRLHKA